MQDIKENLFTFIGRILLSFTFVWAGLGKILSLDQVEMVILDRGIPFPLVVAIITIFIELIFGFALIIGYKSKLTSIILAIYLIAFTIIFHSNLAMPLERLIFIQNMAILGGLLVVNVHGPGQWSLDERNKEVKSEESVEEKA